MGMYCNILVAVALIASFGRYIYLHVYRLWKAGGRHQASIPVCPRLKLAASLGKIKLEFNLIWTGRKHH